MRKKRNRITWKCGSGLARTDSQIERVARRFLIGGEAARRCQWVGSQPIVSSECRFSTNHFVRGWALNQSRGRMRLASILAGLWLCCVYSVWLRSLVQERCAVNFLKNVRHRGLSGEDEKARASGGSPRGPRVRPRDSESLGRDRHVSK